MSTGEVGYGALDASVSAVDGPAAQADRALAAAMLAEAEVQLDAAERALDGTAAKREKFQRLADAAGSDYKHAEGEFARLADLVTARRATLEGLN